MSLYEKKYKEALGWIQSLYNGLHGKTKEEAERYFPELKEIEDERIRKALINFVEQYGDNYYGQLAKASAIAWLEKQGKKDKLIKELGKYKVKYTQEVFSQQLEKQCETFTKKDVDDAYLKGISDAKNEIEKQYEANYQIRKDIATFIFNYRGDIKDRAKWMDYLGIKVSFVEKQGEQKTADEVKPKFHKGQWITIKE